MVDRRHTVATVIAGLAVVLTISPAMAAKEKFVRSKPHVNIVGPLSLTSETVSVAIGLLLPVVQKNPDEDECVGTVDVRVLDAADPGGEPLAQTMDNRLAPNSTFVFDFVPSTSSPSVGGVRVYVFIVLHTASGFQSPDCLLRGQVEVRDNDGKVCRSLAVRPDDFVQLK